MPTGGGVLMVTAGDPRAGAAPAAVAVTALVQRMVHTRVLKVLATAAPRRAARFV